MNETKKITRQEEAFFTLICEVSKVLAQDVSDMPEMEFRRQLSAAIEKALRIWI